jgi:branched-chain amino acid transport system permease protein
VGAAVLTTLPQLLTVFKDYEMVVLGAVLMGVMIFMPRGLVPTIASLFSGRAARATPAADPPAARPVGATEPRP